MNPGLEPKTVVNTHRMLHRAWADFETWGLAKRNVVVDAHPPRVSPVLEVTTGMRRCELAGSLLDLLDLLDLEAGTLDIGPTRVVVHGRVIESDDK